MKELFGQPYSESDPYWVVKGYFDRMYDDGYFIEAVGYIVKRWGFSTDGAYCNSELFGQPYSESDPYWVVKGYFDRMYDDGYFIEAVGYIVKRWGFSTDGAYCNFPDENSPFDEEHFEGVEFSYGYPPKDEDTIVVSEAVCSKFIRLACEKYLQRHPEDTEKVKELLDKLSF